jgi:DNA-binding transcriptional regulator YiaG
MSPIEIKALRVKLNLTQVEFSKILGVAVLSMSQYETGFRNPGPTLLILLKVLDSLPKNKAFWLLDQFKSHSDKSNPKHIGSKS